MHWDFHYFYHVAAAHDPLPTIPLHTSCRCCASGSLRNGLPHLTERGQTRGES